MIHNTLLRAAWKPQVQAVVADDFSRANSTDLGETSVGDVAWQELVGDWSISSNRITVNTDSDPLAVVDALTADVEVQLDVSSTGRDAIIFRCSDANNWWRLANYYNFSSGSPGTTEYQWTALYHSTPDGHSHSQSTWSTNGSSCPHSSSYSHSHDIQGVVQQHTMSRTQCNITGTRTVGGSPSTTTRRVYLDKMVAGSLTAVGNWPTSTTSRLRVVAVGDLISVYSGSGSTLEATVEDSFNNDAKRHGVGRRSSGDSGSAMDNFTLTPAA